MHDPNFEEVQAVRNDTLLHTANIAWSYESQEANYPSQGRITKAILMEWMIHNCETIEEAENALYEYRETHPGIIIC